MNQVVLNHLRMSSNAFDKLLMMPALIERIAQAAQKITEAFGQGGRLYIAGNGGSAADAQHFSAELVGTFGGKGDRPRSAFALTTDTSFLTAWGNDDTFDDIFSRQLQAHARRGDVLFAISTSGNSTNILRALRMASELDMTTIALLGAGGEATKLCDMALNMPSMETPHVQELHIAVIHAICKCISRD